MYDHAHLEGLRPRFQKKLLNSMFWKVGKVRQTREKEVIKELMMLKSLATQLMKESNPCKGLAPSLFTMADSDFNAELLMNMLSKMLGGID